MKKLHNLNALNQKRLVELQYADKMDVLWFIGSPESCMKKIKVRTQKMRNLQALSPLRDRRVYIVA